MVTTFVCDCQRVMQWMLKRHVISVSCRSGAEAFYYLYHNEICNCLFLPDRSWLSSLTGEGDFSWRYLLSAFFLLPPMGCSVLAMPMSVFPGSRKKSIVSSSNTDSSSGMSCKLKLSQSLALVLSLSLSESDLLKLGETACSNARPTP